jgi:hypothetical protein
MKAKFNKEAISQVLERLEKEQSEIRYKLRKNRATMKALAEEQAVLKRELPVLQKLMNELRALGK